MFGGSLVIVEALAHMTQNDTDAMTAVGRNGSNSEIDTSGGLVLNLGR